MPVTARLSKAFYDKLGEQIANELVEWFNSVDATYKTDLREINDYNFERFDARLEQRLAAMEAKLELRLSAMDTRFAATEARFAALETKLVRWMFTFWTGSMLALAGFVYVMLHAR